MSGGLLAGRHEAASSPAGVLSHVTPSDRSPHQAKAPKGDLHPILWHSLQLKTDRTFSIFRCLKLCSMGFPYRLHWALSCLDEAGALGLAEVSAPSPTSNSLPLGWSKENKGQRVFLSWPRLQTAPDWLQFDFRFPESHVLQNLRLFLFICSTEANSPIVF